MRKGLLLIAVLLVQNLMAAVKMDYTISIDTVNHYVDVTLHASNLQGTSTTLKMPVWAPGYYKIMDYPVNVVAPLPLPSPKWEGVDSPAANTQHPSPNTQHPTPLPIEKLGKCSWVISHGEDVKEMVVTYSVYCNEQSVASAQIESNRAFLPLNGILMYVDGEKDSPVTLTVNMPENWKYCTTGLQASPQPSPLGRETENTQNSHVYYTPNFDRLYDSPLLLGNYEVRSFDLDGHHYDLAIETPEGFDRWPLMTDLQKAIKEATKLMGDVPYKDYAFLLMKEGQGGLEHLNSQAVFTEGNYNFPNREEYLRFLSFLTHEYFHLYNVKTIRPIELEPFNYDGEIFSHCLWVSEGLTVYYEYKLLVNAGIMTKDEMLERLSGHIEDIETHEGQRHQSLRQFSYDIFLNFMNWGPQGLKTTVSYYEKGPVIGLLLDIDIQRATNGKKSLDDVMRLLYNRFYKQKNRGFTEEELWSSIAEVAGKPLDDIRTLVDTTNPIDYDSYLNYIGCKLVNNKITTK